tara:strand:+ start:426 stop:866 length:441 start_codon:yes stop_codon:yes gene_type:complete
MLYCLFCYVLYSIITVYAVGDVLSKNIRRRFDTDYGGYIFYIVGCSYRASYTLSIVYSLVCIVILIDIYDMGRVGGQKYTVERVLFEVSVHEFLADVQDCYDYDKHSCLKQQLTCATIYLDTFLGDGYSTVITGEVFFRPMHHSSL